MKELKACRQAISRSRGDQEMYQRAADNAPDEAVRDWNQQRADSARDRADTYERWADENQ
jgi:hypothetical protein